MGLIDIKNQLMHNILPHETEETATDEKIAKTIEEYSFSLKEAKQIRRKNKESILKLQRTMKAINKYDPDKLKTDTIRNIRKYEKTLRNQLTTLITSINLCKRLVENESYEILLDIRSPMIVFEKFFTSLKANLSGMSFGPTAKQRINETAKKLQTGYNKLIDGTISYVQNEMRYYNSIGLDFKKLNAKAPAGYSLKVHLKERIKAKKQILKQSKAIMGHIKKLVARIEKSKEAERPKVLHIVKAIQEFTFHFDTLLKYCEDRIEIADQMIIESITLQKDYYSMLEELKSELTEFYQAFLMEQQRLSQTADTRWKSIQIKSRIKEFRRYQNKVLDDMRDFHERFKVKLEKIENDDIDILRMGGQEKIKLLERLKIYRRRFNKIVIAVTAGTLIAGAAFTVAPVETKQNIFKRTVNIVAVTNKYANILFGVDREFARHYGQKDYRYKIANNAIRHLEEGRYVGTKAVESLKNIHPKFPLIFSKVDKMSCMKFVNTVLEESVPNYQKRKFMDQTIADFKAKGWDIYFVSKDLTDVSTFLNGQTAGDYKIAAEKGRYPHVGKIKNYVVGKDAVHKFQKSLKGKVALVSFNSGFHGALVLDGKVVQAHYQAIVTPVIEGLLTFESHLSMGEIGIWEFAVVAVAPD